jgi:ribosomal protein L37E
MKLQKVKYIIDRSTKIQCNKCFIYEHPALFIDGDSLRMDGVVKCTKCGKMIYYDIQTIYQAKPGYTMLQEIRSEDDIE